MSDNLIDHATLLEYYHYDQETGVFTQIKYRNGTKMDAPPGGLDTRGYGRISIGKKTYKRHRLAFFYITGQWPAGHIDHINGVPGDDRFSNLRDVSGMINAQNLKSARKGNSTGLIGAAFHKASGKYRARIRSGGKEIHIGTFDTACAAHQAYLKAKREMHEGCTI